MFVSTTYEGCRYITAGKPYHVFYYNDEENQPSIIDDEGDHLIIPNTDRPSIHLGDEGKFTPVVLGLPKGGKGDE